MNTYREWRYSSTILDVGTRWRRTVSFTPLPLYLRGKSLRYLSDRRLGGPHSLSGHCGVEKTGLLAGNQTPAIKPVARRYTVGTISAPSMAGVKYYLSDGRAIAQAVSRRLPTAAARVQIRVWSCGIL
jgi:hypothetical protein